MMRIKNGFLFILPWLLLGMIVLPSCTATATPIAESIALVDKLRIQDLDAFEALVNSSQSDPQMKEWYLSRIRQDREHGRALVDQTLLLVAAIGQIDWQTPALRAWEIYRSSK